MSELESVATKRSLRATPVQAKERIEFVDILRGFALLGVLLMNMYGFSGQGDVYQAPQTASGIDRAVVVLVRFLVEAKFYSMFSFLFGWGMAIQMMRAEAKGAKFLPVFLRRLFILLIIGVLHAILIWDGDILTTYALFGFLLLLFRKRSGKALLVTAVLVLSLSIVLTVPGETMDTVREWYANLTDFLRSDTYSESLYATGTYKEVTRFRIQDSLAGHSQLIYYFGNIFGMFLLGLYVGKRRIFREIHQHLPALRKAVWVFLGIGLIFNAIFISTILWPQRVPAEYHRLVRVGGRTIGAPALMLFYVSAIILLIQREDWYRRLAPLANLGRSALSNYLLQSVVCTLIFYNYGLGLYGEIGPPLALILTLAIYWAQVRLSGWWFERFQFGPMEWVWRTLTYGRRQPLRREATQDGRLLVLWRKARQIVARVDPKIALVGAWVVLLLWAGALVTWRFRLEETSNTRDPISNIQKTPLSVAKATATPILAQVDSQTEEQPQVVATPVVQPVAYNPGSIAASGDLLALASTFSAESALAQIEALTGPPYLGRYTGSPEGWAAGDYIAEQFASYGLQPAGDDGAFFQSFPVFYTSLAELPILTVEGPDGAIYDHYTLNEDFIAFVRWYSGSGTANGGVVWANDCTHDDFNPIDVVDKVVLCRSDSVPLMDAERNALEHGAAGLMLLITDPERRSPDFGITHREIWIPEPIPVFRIYPSVADELLLGSGKSVEDLSTSFAPFSLSTQARMEVTTTGPEACPSQGCQGRNVLGVLPGRDPKYADQVIIIGGHYDHLGQTPDGTVWPGANDDASGVAVLLEIARSWHEQGYVPRHTVLFAAWDAEEVGLVGSSYYVEHPRYPLENTMVKIQLDMVGAGGDTLEIDGGGGLAEKLRSVAEALGIETESTHSGGSDHVPFQGARIPAALLIWSFLGETEPQWHRPGDVPETIELDKLDAVGKITVLTTLGFTEAEPAVNELLARRAVAVEQGDLPAFLATSLPDQEAAERFWFDDAQTFAAIRFEMQATNVRALGRTATATVRMTLEYPVVGEVEPEVKTSSLDAEFVHTENGWQWAGPGLIWLDQGPGFALAYPPDKERGLWQLSQLATGKYADIAQLLGLPAEPDATLMLFSRFESLRVSTALSLSPGRGVWIGPGVVKLVYSEGIGDSTQLDDALAQLLLAEAGLTETAAPWLWQGLPLALRARTDLVETHMEYLPGLRKALDDDEEDDTVALNDATAWASVDYLRQQIGWQGLGTFITAFGQACRAGLCESADGMNLALSDTVQMDSATFETAWQTHWRDGLATAQANLDGVLTARTEAVLARDEAKFLNTVDLQVPSLMAEEQHWLAGSGSLTSFSSTGEPLALLEDGSILAEVTMEYRRTESSSDLRFPTSHFQVLFTLNSEGYRWAGVPFEARQSDRGSVLYSEGQEGPAWTLLNEAETIYVQLAADLGVEQPDPLTIKLYESDDVFRASIFPSFPLVDWVPAWTGEGESVKLRWQRGDSLTDHRPTLAMQLARRLLYQLGVDSEWLVKGLSIYLSRNFDGGVTEQAATENLYPLLRAAQKGTVRGLGTIPPDYRLSRDELGLANAQAWDAARYLVYTHGWDALIDLLYSQERLGAALQNAIGQTLSEFEAAWLESVVQGHTLPEWIEVAWVFDPEMANQHVEYLASPLLAGRQAGSPGSEAAAAYIADRFAEYGLVPVEEEDGEATFLQHFPISYTTLLSVPRLEIMDEDGQTLDAFAYREGFLTLLNEAGSGGTAEGELIWIQDGDYEGMELDGKIVLRPPISSIGVEVAQAAEHGAGGFILLGKKESRKQLLAKAPLKSSSGTAIPVLELASEGSLKLLEMVGHTRESILDSPPALLLGLKARLEIPLSTPETVETANVLGLLPGSDPVLGQEVIILGAHYDHVGDDPGRRFAGANDNASGVGVLLEMARLWHETGYRPKRSVLFAAWGAQEPGELGSSYYVDNPVLPLDKTVTMLQLDAVGGGGGYYLEARGEWEQDGVLLFSMMATEDLIDGRLALRGQSGESDQVPFHKAGLPTLLITWRGGSEDNWPVEIADEVDPYRLGVTGRMVTLALMSMAR